MTTRACAIVRHMATDGVLILGARAREVLSAVCDVVRRERRARIATGASDAVDDAADDDDARPDRRRLHLDTKYYSVSDVAMCVGDARGVAVDGIAVDDFTARAYGVKAVVLTSGGGDDDDEFSRLVELNRSSTEAFGDDIGDVDVKILVHDACKRDKSVEDAVPERVRAFAWEKGFEVVAATTSDAASDARRFERRGEGITRVVRALEAVMWSTMVLKPLGVTSDLGREMRSKEKAVVVNALASTLGLLGEVDSPCVGVDDDDGCGNASPGANLSVHERIAALYDADFDINSQSAREARLDKIADMLMNSDL